MEPASALPILLGLAFVLPLASFVFIVLLGPKLGPAGRYASAVATGAIVAACVLSMVAMFFVWLPHHTLPDPPDHGDEGHASYTPAESSGGWGRDARHERRAPSELVDDSGSNLANGAGGSLRSTPATHEKATSRAAIQLASFRSEDDEDTKQSAGEGAGEADGAGHGEDYSEPPPYYAGDWYVLGQFGKLKISIGYYIDTLTVAMFCMVTLVASCIHFYAMGYMHEELHDVTDHEVTLANGEHLKRLGRYHRFFQYLSLFCFSMLGVIISGNIVMVFVFWELVGICSYFLIGFYIERHSASTAANKAFIVNRVGDFGMIIGLMALFGSLGTFAFGDKQDAHGKVVINEYGEPDQPGIFSLVRPTEIDGEPNHNQLRVPGGMVRASAQNRVAMIGAEHVLMGHDDPVTATQSESLSQTNQWREEGFGYWLLVIAGLGIFCGCIGKSAQFPLHTWLPDAMEGPTPVSALVHSATMVAAGVYLVGRFYPVFTPEVLLTIAWVGCITLALAATIAITATDIKRVLAYSTVSQLGYMMLALGVGGWLAGMFHLFTHAFFKSLLFMCSGSVIHAVHSNEMTEMGGLRKKMPWTAYTMLVGCLAIIGAGLPFLFGLSGFHSKDMIVEQTLNFANHNPLYTVFFYAAAGGAAVTAFYMFRLWYMTFAGKPRNQDRYDHAHESPKVMVYPLVVLAVLAVVAGWKLPSADIFGRMQNFGLNALMEQARPAGTRIASEAWLMADLHVPDEHLSHENEHFWDTKFPAGTAAFGMALAGFLLATIIYCWRLLDPAEIRAQFRPIYSLLWHKWWFDELYDTVFVQPTLFISRRVAQCDLTVIDGVLHALAWIGRTFSRIQDMVVDRFVIDGLVNTVARRTWNLGVALHTAQTGKLRQYVMFIIVGTVALFMIISFVWSLDLGSPL